MDIKPYIMEKKTSIGNIALIIGIVFLALSAVSYFVDGAHHFYLTYLTGFFFWLSIALGALIFVMVHHITNAAWSTVLRRIAENLAWSISILVILFIPIIFGMHDIFEWTHEYLLDPASDQYDKIIAGKSGFLNSTFFLIRAAGYFVIWIIFARLLRKKSLDQDNGHTEGHTKGFKKISAPGILLFAVSITFASFDWIMSLDPHWFSTIFGVYIFAGSFLGFMSIMILILAYLKKQNVMNDAVTVEHYHDISKMVFAFIIFWAYMAFSQYFLIWYANLPEENYWFLYRWENSWKYISLLIIFGHFVFPFLALITRMSKRCIGWLVFIAVWMLFMHFIDLYWLIMPTHYRDGWHFSILDIAPLIGIGGLFFWYFWRNLTANSLVPHNDPQLKKSLEFVNN